MRTFELHRDVDSSGVSGTGIVAEGVQFKNGKVVVNWTTKHSTTTVYDSIELVETLHGHGGNTRIVWLNK